MVSWINNPEVAHTLRRHRQMNVLVEEEFIDRTYKSDTDLALLIAVRESDKPVGLDGLHHIDHKNRHAEFGIMIGEPEEWGKGYGTEATRLMLKYAFETLNLNRVWLHVYEYNERALL